MSSSNPSLHSSHENLLDDLRSSTRTVSGEPAVPSRTFGGRGRPDELSFQLQLLNSVHESVVATDLDGHLTYWSRASEKLYGYTPEEVLGKAIVFIVDPSDAHEEHARIEHVLKTGFWKGEYEQRRKDGTKFWSSTTISLVKDDDGRPCGLIGIDIDITDRKREKEELTQLKLAIENAMQGISRLDLDGRFVDVKPQYSRMLGYESGELVGQPWQVTVPREDLPLATEGYRSMLRDGQATLECRAIRKDGSIFYKQLLLVKAFDSHGQRNGHYCFMSDITERREAEHRLREKEAELAHVSRLSTMGELVAGIAHEINQPLYAITNYASVAKNMLAQTGSQPELQELNRQIAEQALRAGDIIRRLRSFVTKSDGNWTAVDIGSLVDDSVMMLTPIIRRMDASVQVHHLEQPVTIKADPVQIEQVLVNLIRNALEAVEKCDSREVSVSVRCEGAAVHVSVADTGPGIPANSTDRLFDAFYTTKASGLGMGLAISKTIVEAHQGRIWVSDGPGGGAVFHFCLPFKRV
jgi:two-component system sensor kinase FixL